MLGKEIKNIRLGKKLSIKDFAVKLNIDASLLSRIESEKRLPTKSILHQISEKANIDEQKLLKLWLEDKISGILQEYPTMASEVICALETRAEYLTQNVIAKVPTLPNDIKNLLIKIDELKEIWVSKKPLNKTQIQKLEEHFNINYTYESNKIEGNTLTLQETFLVVKQGITIGGKTMQEHLEAINHNEAIDFINDLVSDKLTLTERILKQIHYIILNGIDKKNAGVYRSVPVKISGSRHNPPQPYILAKLMEDYFFTYQSQKAILHPVILAAEMHERLVTIHPFIDGNGRTSRLIMNLILLQNGFPICNLKGSPKARMQYYKALEDVQVNNNPIPFYRLIAQHVMVSLNEHLALT